MDSDDTMEVKEHKLSSFMESLTSDWPRGLKQTVYGGRLKTLW